MFFVTILEEATNNRDPESGRHHRLRREFEDLGLAKKWVIDFLIHVIEENLRHNFYKLDFAQSEFAELFDKDASSVWRLKNRHRSDLDGVSMLLNALYLPGYVPTVINWQIESDDPRDLPPEME